MILHAGGDGNEDGGGIIYYIIYIVSKMWCQVFSASIVMDEDFSSIYSVLYIVYTQCDRMFACA